MNAYIHAQISVKKRGGDTADYYAIHDFMDCTKELCSDNRHRILHTMWGVKQVITPIFGHSLTNSAGKVVNIKDMCEQDHILPDYRERFIPTLSDFAFALDDSKMPDWNDKIKRFHAQNKLPNDIKTLLLSPLANTGRLISLVFTHNSWFINEILPRIFPDFEPLFIDFELSPADFFNAMRFEMWMDNGAVMPNSAVL